MDEVVYNQYEFLKDSTDVGEQIHEDSHKARKLFEKLKDATKFEAVIEQRKKESEDFLEEAKSFAQVMKRWSEEYVVVIRAFKRNIKYVIAELGRIPGLKLEYDNQKNIKIEFNETEFVFKFEENFPEGVNKWTVNDETKKELAKEEHKIILELADLLSLEIHLGIYLNYINELNQKHNVRDVAEKIEKSDAGVSPELIEGLHTLTLWWSETNKTLDKIKKDLRRAVEMDKKVSKHLDSFFSKEERALLRENRLKITKITLLALGKAGLGLIPGMNIPDIIINSFDAGKEIKKGMAEFKENQKNL